MLNPNNYFIKNFDTSALEVIDEYDIPVLQVEYLDESRIKIGGIFHAEEKETSEIYPDFPSTPKGMTRVGVFGQRECIMIIGKDGFSTSSRNTSPEELRIKARTSIKPWFDYEKKMSKKIIIIFTFVLSINVSITQDFNFERRCYNIHLLYSSYETNNFNELEEFFDNWYKVLIYDEYYSWFKDKPAERIIFNTQIQKYTNKFY